jgi:hypothetical protein
MPEAFGHSDSQNPDWVPVVQNPSDTADLHQPGRYLTYLVSLCSVWAWQNLQYFRNANFSGVVRLFLVVV